MNKFAFTLLIVFLALALVAGVSAAAVEESCPTSTCPEDNEYCIFYFYGQGCPHCAEVSPVINSLAEKYPNFTLHKLEIYFNESNKVLFDDFVARYKVERAGVPAVFIGSDALLGTEQIKANLESRINFYLENKPVCPLEYKKEAGLHEISPTSKIELTLPAIIAAALIDSINPCAFAVLIFLLVYLTSMASNKRALKIGIVYIATVYIVYFLAGLGLLIAIQSIGITRYVFYLAALISLAAGLINVKDFFWYGKGISLAISEKRKPLIEKYIMRASLSAAIILGIIVSAVELPCTGGVYLAILSLVAKNAYTLAVPYLLLYNLIFVLPLVIILLAVYFGVSAEKAEKLRVEKRKWLRLIMGLAMIGLGLAMLLGWFG